MDTTKTIVMPAAVRKQMNSKEKDEEEEQDDGARRVLRRPSWRQTEDCTLLQIRQKLAGYAYQDRRKDRPPADPALTEDAVLGLLEACGFRCLYCGQAMERVWRTPRDPRQWTLDRVDNDGPHSLANVVASCMECNLRRRARDHARFRRGSDQQSSAGGGGSKKLVLPAFFVVVKEPA